MQDYESRVERKLRRKLRRRMRQEHQSRGANILAGFFLLAIGGIWLTSQLGTFIYPSWLFTWPMIPIVVGLFIGIKHKFQDLGWLIIMGVGFAFLSRHIWHDFHFGDFTWPALVIAIGLLLIFKPRRKGFMWDDSRKWTAGDHFNEVTDPGYKTGDVTTDDIIEVVSVFGHVKKNVFSKTFRGGEIVCVFGGADINLSQADFDKKIVIECVQVFGGTKLIVPANWQVRSEAVAVFGGIEDKRKPLPPGQEPERIVVLKGFTLFGGLEIKSF